MDYLAKWSAAIQEMLGLQTLAIPYFTDSLLVVNADHRVFTVVLSREYTMEIWNPRGVKIKTLYGCTFDDDFGVVAEALRAAF